MSEPLQGPSDLRKKTGTADSSESATSRSSSLGTQQTRFSFYNAQDFVQKSPTRLPTKSSSLSPDMNSSRRRFNFNRITAVKGNAQESKTTLSKANGDDQNQKSIDSVEILRSLQEHEQQRLDILSGPMPDVADSSARRQNGAVTPSAAAANSPTAHADAAPSYNTNPYEDAIKEALDLLRKRRTTTPGISLNETDRDMQRRPASTLDDENSYGDGSALTSPDSSFASHGLGEAYQAEIEARRKQRQERMAKYASRLAELKHESGDNDTSRDSSTALARDDDNDTTAACYNEKNISGPPKVHDEDTVLEKKVPSAARTLSQQVPFHASSESTQPASKEEEVERGVERVLIAILERANSNSRGRAVATSNDDQTNSWQQGEEKKSNSDDQQASCNNGGSDNNVLLQAMTDLLKTGSSSSSLSQQHTQGDLLSTAAQPGGGVLGGPTKSSPEEGGEQTFCDYDDPISASRSADDYGDNRNAVGQQPRQHRERRSTTPPRQQKSLPTAASASEAEPHLHHTELADTSGGIEAVASDPGPSSDKTDMVVSDELDELVRQFSSNSPLSQSESQRSDHHRRNKTDDSVDERVRRLLEEDNSRESSEEDYTDGSDEFVDDEDTTIISSRGADSSEDDDDDDSSYEDSGPHNDTVDGLLGPLNRKAGGTTGVVLEPDSPDDHEAPSILESLSAAMSLVTGTASLEQEKHPKDRYSSTHSSDSDTDDDICEANDLMRTLCAHLLPVGVDQKSRLLDRRPEWDEGNADEPGYRIVRLSNRQLHRIHQEFEDMVNNLKQNSERNLKRESGTDALFERDLQAAEELLDREEKRLLKENALEQVEKPVDAVKGRKSPEMEIVANEDENESGCLPDFPGVKKTGRGEMGDLEYFHLPIIFKSHVTGFEPTKDLVLEPGNVVAGQYLVEGELGSAAFSTAYRCIDLNSEGAGPEDHEQVCLKVIKNTKDFFDQSLDEIKILELLRQTGKCHERFIIEMKTFFYHREHLVIVTELLRQNLFEFGKFVVDHDEEPYFTLPRLSYITRQVLVALDFVHSLGLVHSDVKPENILLGSYSRSQVKLIDFGSSCYLTDRQSSYIQSRSYRAPEVVLGLPYDGRIDIWSLGCVVAEMFTSDVTFQNDSIVSMLSRIEAICGPFPRHMIAQGRQSGRFFTKCGLLFEKVSRNSSGRDSESDSQVSDDSGRIRQVDIFQPKITTMAARLGFKSDLMAAFDSGKKISKEQQRQAVFVDFVRQLLTIDPEARPSASEALKLPWMQYAATLTEEDIKYPSE